MRVVWPEPELDRLAHYYQSLPLETQRALGATVERVNQTLATKPTEVGESRGGNFRVWIVAGITYSYEVLPNEVQVTTFHVPDPPRKR